MTKVKFCGLTDKKDILYVNELLPDYIGFVFAEKSRRRITPKKAFALRKMTDRRIAAVGVFVGEPPENVAELLENGTVDIAQLHGNETPQYISRLRSLTDKPIIQAFCVKTEKDIIKAEESAADCILLDSGAGSGAVFDWELIKSVKRKYFLAGGLSPSNVNAAISRLNPYAVDVSSGIETDGIKDIEKMREFLRAVKERTDL